MRGDDQQQNHMFSYLSPEMRVRKDHPLRAIRAMVDEVLHHLSRRFDSMYARVGRPSIAPEKLLRAQLLQMLYSIRSEPGYILQVEGNRPHFPNRGITVPQIGQGLNVAAAEEFIGISRVPSHPFVLKFLHIAAGQ